MLIPSVFTNKKGSAIMSLAQDGMKAKIKTHRTVIEVPEKHPLILLANALPWSNLSELVCEDLKKSTAKGVWMVGRKLYVRTHLAIYILQARTKKTDREIISEIKDNAVYQAFCGSTVIDNWKCPHATKAEEFRSRLSPETKMKINDLVVAVAVDRNFADPSAMDVDSTVQEANISYPTDAGMLMKLAKKCAKVATHLKVGAEVNMKKIGSLAKGYFFRKKGSAEDSSALLKKLHTSIKEEIIPVIQYSEKRVADGSLRLKWNIKKVLQEIALHGRQYLRDSAHFIRTHTATSGKALSFHAAEVTCVSKGKVAKKHEFGRVFQIGRIAGNFLIALNTKVNLSDKKAIKPMLEKHEKLFGSGELTSLSTDRGYYSQANVRLARRKGVEKIGIQKYGPGQSTSNEDDELRRRRAGIEPLIGHAKSFGLGRSKMKNDKSTHGNGFSSIMGFNLCQLERRLKRESLKIAK